MLLIFQLFYDLPIILKFISTKIDLLTKIHATNLLINTKKIIYKYK